MEPWHEESGTEPGSTLLPPAAGLTLASPSDSAPGQRCTSAIIAWGLYTVGRRKAGGVRRPNSTRPPAQESHLKRLESSCNPLLPAPDVQHISVAARAGRGRQHRNTWESQHGRPHKTAQGSHLLRCKLGMHRSWHPPCLLHSQPVVPLGQHPCQLHHQHAHGRHGSGGVRRLV